MDLKGLDSKDRQIIELLLKDGRITHKDIADAIGISRPAVAARIASLEEEGIIAGYKAVLSPEYMVQANSFVVNLDVSPGQFEKLRDELEASELVVSLMQTTGHNHLMAICTTEKTALLRQYFNGLCRRYDGIVNIRADAILEVTKGLIIPD